MHIISEVYNIFSEKETNPGTVQLCRWPVTFIFRITSCTGLYKDQVKLSPDIRRELEKVTELCNSKEMIYLINIIYMIMFKICHSQTND